MRINEEYLRRNHLHAISVGLQAGITSLIEHLTSLKSTPKWILCQLKDLVERADKVKKELVTHRAEVPQMLEKDININLSESQAMNLFTWRKTHKCKTKETAAGGMLTYKITPTGIGDIIEVSCVCGSKINLTEEGNW